MKDRCLFATVASRKFDREVCAPTAACAVSGPVWTAPARTGKSAADTRSARRPRGGGGGKDDHRRLAEHTGDVFRLGCTKRRQAILWAKRSGSWVPLSWTDAARSVRLLARGLRALGVQRGDRVAIVVENRPEWVVADLAVMAAGAVTVPAYTTYTTEDYRHVLADSDARILILGAGTFGRLVLPAADQLDNLTAIVALEPLKRQTRADSYSWDAILAQGAAAPDEVDATVASLQPDDTACLIYTSGTGGVPKGVMLTHRNMMSNAAAAKVVFEAAFTLADEVFLSLLPLTHSYEHTAGVVFPLSLGAQTYFTTPETVAGDLREVRPTLMTAVPRLCETLRKRILQNAERTRRLAPETVPRSPCGWAPSAMTRRTK